MAIEIERKFLVVGDTWRRGAKPRRIQQGYLFASPTSSARVRLADGRATLTIKADLEEPAREEFEYEIPAADAQGLLQLCCHQAIDKVRHEVTYAGKLWEIDEFAGPLKGLIIAEIELDHVDEAFERPAWLGQEVTFDRRYRNSALSAYGIPNDEAAA